MATASDGRAPYESGGGTEEKLRQEPQDVSQEAGRNNLTGESEVGTHQGGNPASISATLRISELEQMLKQMTFTRSEASTSGLLKQMASPQHAATMEDLPEELLLNIFIRLFSKQLAQMRSVSKSWNAFLSQSSFIKSHLHRSIHNNDQIILVFYLKACSCDSKPFTAHPSQSPHLELTEFNKLPPVNPETGTTENIRVIGAVNGLICSSYGDSVVHIWNPSLSAVLTLPPCPMPSRHSYEINLRFGFDPKNNDYKVLKILSQDDFDYSLCIYKERRQVEVFSMRKGSWEEITQWYPSHIKRIFCHDGVCVDGHDGHLHWLGHYFIKERYSDTIVAFDLGSHTFSEMPFPVSMRDHTTKTENLLGVLATKLCVMAWHDNDVCDVWVMEEYGVAESWVKRHVFSQFFGQYTIPCGFTSHNEFLFEDHNLLENSDHRLVLYDPIANNTKNFEKFSCSEGHRPHMIVEYVDSLVWVAPAKYEMVDGGGQN